MNKKTKWLLAIVALTFVAFFRLASVMIATMRGAATTPFVTAAQKRAFTGSRWTAFNPTPASVESATTQ